MRVRKHIGAKQLIGLVVFALLLATSICALVAHQFRRRTIDQYNFLGASLTQTLATQIDGARAAEYLVTGEKDDYYYEIENLVVSLQAQFGAMSVYVAEPDGLLLHFIWSNEVDDGVETLGFTEDFTPGGEEWIRSRMKPGSENTLWFVDDPMYGSLAIAGCPVLNSDETAQVMVFADFSLDEIQKSIREMTAQIIINVLLLMLAFVVVYSFYVNRKIVRPILKLTDAAESMTANLEGNTAYVSDIHTGDELETLSKSFEKMDGDLRHYIEDNLRISAERQRLGAELDLAASIQSGQLPSTFPAFPDRSEFDIHASMTPAKTVGGDFYDFFLVGDDHIALVMADVSGKGVPAALFMMISRILLKNHLQAGESPAQALTSVNRQLLENNAACLFVTVWVAVVELSTGRGVAANAGHEHPTLRRSGGPYELVEYKHASPVGILKRAKFAEHEFELHPGDSLFVYTDGVAEATDRNNVLFGNDRMLAALNKEPDADCARVLDNMMADINAFVDGAEQFDDITMLCFRYFGPREAE